MKNYKVAIIGGGPAGMMAAISTAQELKGKSNVVVIEKNESLGKKLLLTGGGRCNITNLSHIKKFLGKFEKEDKLFLKHAFYTFDNKKLLSLFESEGLEFKEEENHKCFPITDDSNSILKILKDYLDELNVDILVKNSVKYIINNNEKKDNFIKKNIFKIKTEKETIYAEKVILATGGISYPQTGSTGDGYKIAADFGHSLITPKPGLISLNVENSYFKHLSGITFENIEVSFKTKGKTIKTKGNVLITHSGLSGPAILDISNYIVENIDKEGIIDKNNVNIENNNQNDFYNDFNYDNTFFENVFVSLDLIPDLNKEELNEKMTKDSQANGKTMVKNYMKYYLKNRFIDSFLNMIEVSGNKTLSNMTKNDKNKIIANLKDLNVKINGIMPKETSMITCGGIKTNEINSKTMKSKLCNGLYFAGELIESYGPTGGYNLQIAFSTGFLAGKSVADSIKN
ncbi:putative thiazole biosynthetic enzyme [Methanobrevibacter cuticularis]|uniref:Putative thiazole biosynthetic enzyme n=1 Tax=Methanobrevibacter cuticularis TaxID=47311 RepID=A0A166E273_9EURY|nr:NAD(P)/FAD-dependent oxidoreductase [Methanobrevibacter cuticularis]KZX16198.1 putative thiazole biosynthetic enzyme [Methanobrevibacter cuticularis]